MLYNSKLAVFLYKNMYNLAIQIDGKDDYFNITNIISSITKLFQKCKSIKAKVLSNFIKLLEIFKKKYKKNLEV